MGSCVRRRSGSTDRSEVIKGSISTSALVTSFHQPSCFGFNPSKEPDFQNLKENYGHSGRRSDQEKVNFGQLGNYSEIPNDRQIIEPLLYKSAVASCFLLETSDEDFAKLDTDGSSIKFVLDSKNNLHLRFGQSHRKCIHRGSKSIVQQVRTRLETGQHKLGLSSRSNERHEMLFQDCSRIHSSDVRKQPTNLNEFAIYSMNVPMNNQVQSNIGSAGHRRLPESTPMINPVHLDIGKAEFQSTLKPINPQLSIFPKNVPANIGRVGNLPSHNQVTSTNLGQIGSNVTNNQQSDPFGAISSNISNVQHQQSKTGQIGEIPNPFVQFSKLTSGANLSNVPNVQQSQANYSKLGAGDLNIQQPRFDYGQAINAQIPQTNFGCFGSHMPINNPPLQSNTGNVQFHSTNAQGTFQPQPNISNLGFQSMNVQSNQMPQPNFGFQSTKIQPAQPNISYFGSNLSNIPVNQSVCQSLSVPNVQMAPLNISSNNLSNRHLIDYSQLCIPNVALTPNQIAARHAMEKRLPRFFGEPKKWQLFESAFITATVNYGLNNAENLMRLQDCLKGDALETVQSQLVHSESVPGVMNTLRMMYGRPESIINKLLEDARQTVSPKAEDLSSLVKFAVSVQNLSATVTYFNATEHLRNPMLIKTLTDKLPAQIQLNWAFYKQSVGEVNLSIFGNWLFQLANVVTDVVELPTNSNSIRKAKKEENLKTPNSGNHVNALRTDNNNTKKSSTFGKANRANQGAKSKVSSTKNSSKCKACDSDSCKKLASCKKFKELSPEDRWELIKKNRICGCCFGNHLYFRCENKKLCGIDGCTRKHHELLHNPSFNIVSDVDETPKHGNSHRLTSSIRKDPDIFRIVPVILSNSTKSIRIFAYLDDGSNLTSLEESVAKRLGAYGTKENICVLWSFGDSQVESDSTRLSIKISGVQENAEEYYLHHVRTVKKLGLPTQSITLEWMAQYPYMRDIPITPYNNATPQMIIGLQYSKLMVSLETIEGEWNQPIVCRTRLGWIVQGPNDHSMDNAFARYSLNMCECQTKDNDLHELVQQFFSIENFGVKTSGKLLESKALSRARQILEKTTIKKGAQYETALLWRQDNFEFPDSYGMAKRRLECVESKLRKDPILASRMQLYIKDFLSKEYIRKLSIQEQKKVGPRTWYLPIFPVFNPKKPEKLRVVWDGAAKVKGISLNSKLLTGPDQLVPLPDLLRRFRERKIGITGDIAEMFHQVLIRDCDQDSQRFLWRDGDTSKDPDVYVMRVMTFGSTCSPCSAQYIKNKNAAEFKDDFPEASNTIINSHYVDDMIESAHTEAEAIKLVNDVKFIHQHAGFQLRSFTSNSQQVLQAINGNKQFCDKNLDDKALFSTERVLGMYWETGTDTYTYSIKFIKINDHSENYFPTKREILRVVMSVFDPLGFLAHFVIYAKILLQEIWRSKVDWDDQLPVVLRDKWLIWLKLLPSVETVHIPRLLSARMSPEPAQSIQLHVFVDAGVEAYAAVAYFRIENHQGVDSCLIGAKSKVAPNKPVSVPRLELQGGVLGTRLVNSLLSSHNRLSINKTVIWCDSRTVLSWINSDFRRYSQFVAFRVGEIMDSANKIEWRWIPSDQNVADEATKSKKIPDLKSSSRWFIGPAFLRDKDSNYTFELEDPSFQTDEELRPYYSLTHLEIPLRKFIEFERFSNWQRLVRITAYVLRFIRNLKSERQHRHYGLLSMEEFQNAENALYKQAQYDSFMEELVIVRWNETAPVEKQKEFDKSSIIRLCSPYLDDQGVLRIKGRIDAATSISDSVKRPIILAKNHWITHLIVDSVHRKYLHLHHQTVLNEIKQKFWIPKLRVVLGMIRKNCQQCKNTAAVPKIPEMAPLPLARLAINSRPYTYAGIDYFGPILVVVNRGTQKRWGVLITCLTTRAVHLEVAHSLNTDSCIMAIRNFIGRCGQPRELYSDNGTNMHGSDNALKEEFAKLDRNRIQEEFTSSEMSWSFNPPAAPHMGGSWERMVGIVKKCLDEVMTIRYPTDEVLKNLFIETENIVNSRPLTYVSLDSPDDEVLTPNHFLLGSSNGLKPPGDFTDQDLLKNTWQTVQRMADKFWQLFVVEYLPTLVRRTKWHKNVQPIKVDDIVVIADENFKRNTWPKAIVVEVFPDKFGIIRRAKVRTDLGTFLTRPVAKLAVLDVRRSENQQDQENSGEIHNSTDDTVKLIASVNGGQNVVEKNLN